MEEVEAGGAIGEPRTTADDGGRLHDKVLGKLIQEMAGAVNEAVERAFGKATTIEHVAFPEGEEVLDAGDYVADAGKFRAATGWHPRVPFEEGLARTVAYFRERE